MKARKRFLSMILILAMVLSLFPVTAAADAKADVIVKSGVTYHNVTPQEMFAGHSDPVVAGRTYNGDPERGAYCEIYNANNSQAYIHNCVARSGWGNWKTLYFSKKAEVTKWLFEYDPKTDAYIIKSVADQPQHNCWMDWPDPESTTWKSLKSIGEDPPYVWDTYNKKDEEMTHQTDGSKLVIYTQKADSNKDVMYQRWKIYLSDEGRYIIQNAGSGQYVSLADGCLVQKKDIEKAYLFEIDRISQSDNTHNNYYFGYAERWMADLPDDALLSSVNMPGTHDTGTARMNMVALKSWWKDQSLYFSEQLNAGVRYFDVRVHPTSADAMPEDVVITHFENCVDRDRHELTLRKMWDQAVQFLKENPSETIIFQVSLQGPDTVEAGAGHAMAQLIKESQSDIHAVGATRITDYVWQGDTVPTVGEARGKIILWRSYDLIDEEKPYGLEVSDFGLCTMGEELGLSGMEEYAKAVTTDSESYPVDPTFSTDGNEARIAKYIQHEWEVSPEDKMRLIKNAFKQAAGLTSFPNGDGKVYFVNTTNCTGDDNMDMTYKTSEEINDMVNKDENGYLTGNNFTGIVTFNYVNSPLSRRIYSTNFTGTKDFFVYSVKNAEVTCSNMVYTGEDVTPEITVKLPVVDKVNGGTKTVTLTKDVDYTVTYDNNKMPSENAGYTITGIGKYDGTKTGTFTIEKTDAVITVMDNPTKEYDGMSVFPPANKTNAPDHIMNYVYYDATGNVLPGAPVNVGHYSVVIEVSGSSYTYDGKTDPIEFDILPKDLTLYLNSFKNEDDGTAGVTCKASGFLSGGVEGSIRFNVNGDEYVVDLDENGQAKIGSDSIAEGVYNVTASYVPGGNGNYTADDASARYNKNLESRHIILTSDEITETYSEGKQIDLADYVSTDHNENGVASWTYTIEKDLITSRFPNLPATATVTADGLLTVENAGVVKVKIKLEDTSGQYYNECQAEITVKITRGDLTVSTSAYKDDPDTPGGKIPVTTATYGDLEGIRYEISAADENGDAVDVTTDDFTNGHGYLEAVPLSEETGVSRAASIGIMKVGTGSINFRGNTYDNLFLCRNYSLVFNPGSVAVNPAPLTVKAENAVGYYNGKEPSYRCSVEGLAPWDSEDDVFESLSAGLGTGMSYEGLDPGEYDIIPDAELPDVSNYEINSTVNGKLTVNKGDPKLKAVPSDTEKIYDGSAVTGDFSVVPELNTSVTLRWMAYDESTGDFTTMSSDPVEPGTYRLQASTPGNDKFKGATAYSDVTICPASQGTPEITGNMITYTGEAQSLGSVTPGTYGGTVLYSLGEPIDEDNLLNYSNRPPKAEDAGTYEVYFYIAPSDSNHSSLSSYYTAAIIEDPEWLTDPEQEWIKGSSEGLVFRSSAPFNTYISTLWEGEELSEDAFDVYEGSTIVSLKPSYLNSLNPGKYKLTVVSDHATIDGTVLVSMADNKDTGNQPDKAPTGEITDGSAAGGDKADADSTSKASSAADAGTGDSSMTGLWVILLILSAAGIMIAVIVRRKKGMCQ